MLLLNINYINEINNLRNQLNNKNKDGYVNFNNIMVVHFISGDNKINQGIKCLPTDTFAQVEEKLYKIYNKQNFYLIKYLFKF